MAQQPSRYEARNGVAGGGAGGALLRPSMPAAHSSSSSSSSSSNSSLPHRLGQRGHGVTLRHPPTLQSDAVVFQQAKIPLSSARLPVAPARETPPMSSSSSYPNTSEGTAVRRQGSVAAAGAHDNFRTVAISSANSPFIATQALHNVRSSMQQQEVGGARDASPSGDGRKPMRHHAAGGQRDPSEPVQSTSFTHLLTDAVVPAGSSESSQQHGMNRANQPRYNDSHSHAESSPVGQSTPVEAGRRMTVRVMKEGDKLGFGIRHDPMRKIKVSTLVNHSAAANSSLRVGDTLLSVNGIDLQNMEFLEVIQRLKATKPGELVFDIERDEERSHNQTGAYERTDLPTPSASPANSSSHNEVMESARDSGSRSHSPSTESAVLPHQLQPTNGAVHPASNAQHSDMEPQRKRARVNASPPVIDINQFDRNQKQAITALMLSLQKEREEKKALEEKNRQLRNRLQKMLIECDEVRVKASTEIAAVKEIAKRDVHELERSLLAARAQLRIQDRGPNVARTDSMVNDLNACRVQLERMRKSESERTALMNARFNMENRHADREALRVREALVLMICNQLRQIAKRSSNGNPAPSPWSGKSSRDDGHCVAVQHEGIRRMAFMKLFGFPCEYDLYISNEFHSLTQVHHTLQQSELVDLFGNSLFHEERAGLFLVACAPMDVVYDPSTERLNIVCSWTEQNAVRELARNFRF